LFVDSILLDIIYSVVQLTAAKIRIFVETERLGIKKADKSIAQTNETQKQSAEDVNHGPRRKTILTLREVN